MPALAQFKTELFCEKEDEKTHVVYIFYGDHCIVPLGRGRSEFSAWKKAYYKLYKHHKEAYGKCLQSE